jgi:hypothetical protein
MIPGEFNMMSISGPSRTALRSARRTVYISVLSFTAIIMILVCRTDIVAETKSSDEYAVKAAFLYNFAKFIEWPAGSFSSEQSPLVICIAGQDPFNSRLDAFSSKTVSGRKITVRRLSQMEDHDACHILFISRSEKGQIQTIINSIKNRNILTVSDMTSFSRAGGIISLYMEEDRMRFEINLSAAERTGLRISSNLLALARIFRESK